MQEKQVIGVVQVLQHLKDGWTRDDVAEFYGLSKTECKLLFKHEDLIGKKTHKKPSFTIVPDASAVIIDQKVVEAEVKMAETETENFIADEVEKKGYGEKFLKAAEIEVKESEEVGVAPDEQSERVDSPVEIEENEEEEEKATDVVQEAAKAQWS